MKTKFLNPEENKNKYYDIAIKNSTIPQAGMGAFALEKIPKGAIVQYKGEKKTPENGDAYYSWAVYDYDKETGEIVNFNELFWLDAKNPKKSNFTRYVNCGLKKKFNNMDSFQKFDKIYYYTLRDIQPGEELFIDYGPNYRKVNLGMKGRY